MADLETLTLQINAESQKAYNAIDKLAQRLDRLSGSIASLETGKLYELAGGLNNLRFQLLAFNTKSSNKDFKHLVNNIHSFTTIDTSRLDALSASLGTLSNAFTGMSSAAAVSDNVKTLVASIGKLGGVSIQRAITNIPLLESSLSHLIRSFSTLPNINQSVLDFTNSLANLASQGQRIGSAANTINNSLDRFGESASRATRKSFNLASAIGKVYAQFWIAMRAASGLKNAFKDAADYLEAYNYFEVVAEKIGTDTFRKAGIGSADKYADAFTQEMRRKLKQMSGLELDLEDRLIKTTNAKSLGLNLTELTQYQASIASITNSMGLAQEVSTSAAKAFSMLAADMGSLRNVDFEQISQNLQSGLTGAARSLYKYGIDITNATLQQYAYANGVDKAVSEMTQAEKAQLRLLAILDQSKVAWGDLANTINSPANQLRQLKTNLAEVGTVLGQLFIPVLQKTLPWINGLSIAFKELLVDIAGILGIELSLDEFGAGFSDTIDEDTESLDDLNKTMKETKKGIREFDELKVIGANKDDDKSGLSDQIDLTQQILAATAEYEKVWDEAYERMTSKAHEIAKAISGALDPIRQIVEDFHIGNFFKAGEDVSSLVASIFNFVAEAISKVNWNAIGEKVGNFLKGVKWGEILKSIGNVIGKALQGALNLWKGAFSVAPFETAILTAFALLKFTGFGNIITSGLSKAISKQITSQKMSKEFASALGKLGAVSIGVSIAVAIDNVESVKKGEYSAYSLQSLLQSMVSTLFGGAGIALAAKSIGFASGGLAFGIGAAVTLLVNLIALAAVDSPYASAERVWAAEYEWVKEHDLNNMEIITNIKVKEGEVDVQISQIDDLADKVYDLSLSYEDLTDGEKYLLKYYSDELINVMPELANQIDSVTGAYRGTREELDKLIQKQKEQIMVSAYQTNMGDLAAGISSSQYDLKELKFEQGVVNRKIESIKNRLKEDLGEDYTEELWDYVLKKYKDREPTSIIDAAQGQDELRNKAILSLIRRDEAEDLLSAIVQQEQLDQSIYTIQNSLGKLQNEYDYYANEIKRIMGETVPENIEEGDKKAKDEFQSSKVPDAVKTMVGKVDTNINNGTKVAKTDMWNMFNSINNSFAGIGDGKVPAEIQTLMDNIKTAIETNSPELIQYMADLKLQMEQAFVNAHYTTDGNVLYNVNGISEKLDKDANSIAEAMNTGAKPTTKKMENDLHELFGETLPDTVDKGLKDLASTIDSGAGQKAVMGALDTLKAAIVKEGKALGLNLEFGIIDGIYSGTAKVAGSVTTLVDDGLVTPYETKTETNSPSRLFRRLATNIPEGIALGIEDDTPEVDKAIKTLASSMQSTFSGMRYNIPSLGLGTGNRNSYLGNARTQNASANAGFLDQMMSARNNSATPVEVVFRVEGDPTGLFRVVREEDLDYYKRNGHSAFAYGGRR